VTEQGTDAPQASSGEAAEAVDHWRALRERLEDRIRSLRTTHQESRGELRAIDGPDAVAAERSGERLLRLRRLRAKVLTRERLAVLTVVSEGPDRELRHA
jgi:hypothetical protein